ncbi:hypothetical protein BLX88_21335, partial [Bacillus obstructivus]
MRHLQAGIAKMRLVEKGSFDFHPQIPVCGLVREIGKCMDVLGISAMRFQRLFSESPVPRDFFPDFPFGLPMWGAERFEKVGSFLSRQKHGYTLKLTDGPGDKPMNIIFGKSAVKRA